MNRFVKHGLSLASAGVIVLSFSGCGFVSEASSEPAKLGCADLENEVQAQAPDEKTPLSEFKPKKYEALTKWMVKNAKEFDDKKVAKAVETYGKHGRGYYAKAHSSATLSGKQHDKFETASRTIEDKCPGLGFGFEGDS